MEHFSGCDWLRINVANQFGYDKLTYEERLDKSEEFVKSIKDIGLENTIKKYAPEADEPNMFTRGLIGINDVIQTGETNILIGQDAASSGPQIDTTSLRDIQGMVNTGAISDRVPDVYSAVQSNMQKSIKINLMREQVKKATIPYVYGSSAVPKAVFGDNYGIFKKAFFEELKGVVIINNALIDAWDPNKTVWEWVLPDGFNARTISTKMKVFRMEIGETSYSYMKEILAPKEKGDIGTKALSANVTHSVDGFILRELHRRCNWNEDKYFLALNTLKFPKKGKNHKLENLEKLSRKYKFTSWEAIEYLQTGYVGNCSEAWLEHLQGMLDVYSEPFEVVSIHDEFMCGANHVNVMKQVYNDILSELYRSSLIPQIICDLRGDTEISRYVGKFQQNIFDKIKNNRYAIS